MSKSPSQVLWAFGFAGLGVLRSEEIDPLPRREGTSRNGSQPTADALLTLERFTKTVAIHGRNAGTRFIGWLSGAAQEEFHSWAGSSERMIG